LKIPYGNKEIALKLGARYGAGGWYAPQGINLSAFKDRGWLWRPVAAGLSQEELVHRADH
jgi:Domain of unknown function (DUF5710)